MNYKKHYELLIAKHGSATKPEGYSERHHIVPRCMGGSNATSNLIYLSAKAHLIAHQLLAKMHPLNAQIIHAIFRMSNLYLYGSKQYAWVKARYAESIKGDNNPSRREEVKQKISDNNPMKLDHWRKKQKDACNTPERKAKMSAISSENNCSRLPHVKILRSENFKKRIAEGTIIAGAVNWTPELIAKSKATRLRNKIEAHARGEKYPKRTKLHHTKTPEGSFKQSGYAKKGWETRRNNMLKQQEKLNG